MLSPIPYNGDLPELKPLSLCTFSRVMKEKGIEDVVNAVKTVNDHFGRTVYTLDIYGQVDSAQTEWFNELKSIFSSYIKYGELVPFDKSVEVLKNYFALLFPTYYEGEGFAGTLLDAMAAGVPVIASDWRYNTEIVNEKTGYVYSSHDNRVFFRYTHKCRKQSRSDSFQEVKLFKRNRKIQSRKCQPVPPQKARRVYYNRGSFLEGCYTGLRSGRSARLRSCRFCVLSE